jgi:hypothetical protein
VSEWQFPLVFCDEYSNLLLVAFCGGSSWLNAARQTSNVPVAIFEVFHLMSHTAGIHAVISTDMMKSTKDVCSKTVLLYEEFNHSILAKQYIIYSHFVTVDYGLSTGAHELDLSFRVQKTDTAFLRITLYLFMSIEHTLTDTAHYFWYGTHRFLRE